MQARENEKIVFLIEGHGVIEGNFRDSITKALPERAAIALARINNYRVFDIIEGGFNLKTYRQLLKDTNELKQKMIVLHFILLYEYIYHSDHTMQIKELYQQAIINKNSLKLLPEWLCSLNPSTFKKFQIDVCKEVALNINPNVEEVFNSLADEIIDLSNQLSFANLIDFLRKNPAIETIYSLIGKEHLAIAYLSRDVTIIEKKTKNNGEYICVELNIDKRKVKIHFFGGSHQINDHYELFLEHVINITDIKIPTNTQLNLHFSLFIKPSPLTFLQDKKLLAEAKALLDKNYPEIDGRENKGIFEYRERMIHFFNGWQGKLLKQNERDELKNWIVKMDNINPQLVVN